MLGITDTTFECPVVFREASDNKNRAPNMAMARHKPSKENTKAAPV
jgi:hypothetical protein